MMSKPLVSVIMGIYNCENSIEAAIESILQQTYDNWELIMCDDGSTDSTYSIATKYMEKYSDKIVVLKNEKNLRLAATLNRCLGVAKGEYIARMDADDVCLPERLEKQVAFLDNNPQYACVGSNMIVFDEYGDHGIRVIPQETKESTLLKTTIFAHPTIMMRSSVYQELGGYTVSKRTMRAEDLDLWFRFVKAGYKGYNIQDPLYRYRECEKDLNKRSLHAAIQTSKVFFDGYKMLGFSRFKYIYALRPIIVAMLPNSVICQHHKGTQIVD